MSTLKIVLILYMVFGQNKADLAYHQKRFRMSHKDIETMYQNITGQIKSYSEILEDHSTYIVPDVSIRLIVWKMN